MFVLPDLDVDVKSREMILNHFSYIPASKVTSVGLVPHGVGVYFCDIPKDFITGLATIDYKSAEEDYGYIKIDLLHNCELDHYNTRSEMTSILSNETNWDLLKDEDVVSQLPHINSYFGLLRELPPIDSIEKLAMFISVIRPAKKYLIEDVKKRGWDSISDKIWTKETDGYQYKKSHAIAYATLIKLAMNRINKEHSI